MRILEIPVKYQKEDILYTTKQITEDKVCSICEGKKTIFYNSKNMTCPECMGKGKFNTNKKINIVCEEPFVIHAIKIDIKDKGTHIKYRGKCGCRTLNRTEDNLFLTKEEAQVRCDKLNKERVYIKISDIIIQDDFLKTQPSIDKIQAKLDYYKSKKKFDKQITINKENVLQDGYITYLLCKMFNVGVTKAIVERT